MKLSSVKSTCTQNEKRLPWVTPGNGPGNFQSGAPRVKEQPVSRAVVLAAAMGGWVEKVACVPDELTKEPRMWSGRGREEGRRGGCGRVCGCLSCVLVRFYAALARSLASQPVTPTTSCGAGRGSARSVGWSGRLEWLENLEMRHGRLKNRLGTPQARNFWAFDG